MKFDLRRPCADCPFRHDRPGFLIPERADAIATSVIDGYGFPCHKTTVMTEDEEGNEDLKPTPDSQLCAGAAIFMECNGGPNGAMRIAAAFLGYDGKKLDMTSPTVRTREEFVAHQRATMGDPLERRFARVLARRARGEE